MAVAVVPSTHHVCVADGYHSVIVLTGIDLDRATIVRSLGKGRGSGPNHFDAPHGLAVLDGDSCGDAELVGQLPLLAVADTNNHRVVLYRLNDGTVWRTLGCEGSAVGQVRHPSAVATLPTVLLGRTCMAVADSENRRVQVMTLDGVVLHVLEGSDDHGIGRLSNELRAVAVCLLSFEVLVTDTAAHRVVAWRLDRSNPQTMGRARVVCGGGGGLEHDLCDGSDDAFLSLSATISPKSRSITLSRAISYLAPASPSLSVSLPRTPSLSRSLSISPTSTPSSMSRAVSAPLPSWLDTSSSTITLSAPPLPRAVSSTSPTSKVNSALAGDSSGQAAGSGQLLWPDGLVATPSGEIWVSDNGNHRLCMFQ